MDSIPKNSFPDYRIRRSLLRCSTDSPGPARLKLKVDNYYRNGARHSGSNRYPRPVGGVGPDRTLTRKISLGQKEVQLEPHEHEKFSRWLLF